MKIIEKKVLKTDEVVLLVSDDSLRRFNIAYLTLNITDTAKEEINLEKAKFIFPYMINKNKAREEYIIHAS